MQAEFFRVVYTSCITLYRNLPVLNFLNVTALLELISWNRSVSAIASMGYFRKKVARRIFSFLNKE
jgi:hypothetical protein